MKTRDLRFILFFALMVPIGGLLLSGITANEVFAIDREDECERTPGFWKQAQHSDSWNKYYQQDSLNSIFESKIYFDLTLNEALNLKGGGKNAFGRHLVAALLNATCTEVLKANNLENSTNKNNGYLLSEAEVINLGFQILNSDDPERIESAKDFLVELNEGIDE